MLVAGSLGAAWLLSKTHDATACQSPVMPVNPDGVRIDSQWYHVQAAPHFETMRNFLIAARNAGHELDGFQITGDSDVTNCWQQADYSQESFTEGGFTLADVEDWQDAGNSSYN
jgi:hypothetical protein